MSWWVILLLASSHILAFWCGTRWPAVKEWWRWRNFNHIDWDL